jgi:uncharacterized membrane protein
MTAYEVILRLTLVALSLAGLYSCFCFARSFLGKYIKKLAEAKPVEVVCHDGTCMMLDQTRWSRLLWVPNWWFGTLFYLLTLLSALWPNIWVITFALLGTLGAVIFSIILIYGLLFRLKAVCMLCYVAHAVNFALLIVWFVAIWQATIRPL